MANKAKFFNYTYDPSARRSDDPDYISAVMRICEFLKPSASPYKLLRIGGAEDGAYLVPNDLSGVGACFSPGVNNFKNFEDDLVRRWAINSHMCDYSSDESKFKTPLIRGRQTFKKLWLNPPGIADSIDLETWVTEFLPDQGVDALLQMDIEGAEYKNIIWCPSEILRRFRIIVIEVHRMNYLRDPTVTLEILEPFFSKLATEFVCVHAHPNNCCGEEILELNGMNIPAVLELTLLRKDRLQAANGARVLSPMLPHPKDIRGNMPSKKPIVLNSKWLPGPRPLRSRIKMVEDQIAWRLWQNSHGARA